jgi:hypothetical protein
MIFSENRRPLFRIMLGSPAFSVQKNLMMGSKRNALANLTDRLIDQTKGNFAMAAFIGRCLFQLMVRVLQQAQRGVHVRLLGQGISRPHARRDGQRNEQSLARY